ncbi:MAG TPA: LLM class flavin-dependent oxidoreductase, partial [Kineosporiaceae bacterium]|nr:LLM class flavin-dependent oxidoreductase [Kineosporiaceae bacterium]
MRLGLNLGYWGAGNDAENIALAREADRLGYSVVWAAEAYGSDAPTVLAWVAAQTERIDVGSAVMQIPARTPAMTAMTAATLDSLSGGRFRLGLGVSGPQVSEGWYGVKFDKPLGRTREYVEIVKKALRRERV